ncbi:MAG: polyhydroxyalkanoate synthesis regulator DNA-binding domain-containing protein [Myxococcota bacterium]
MPLIVVKKYSNRRLYDTDESRYITLEELAEKIQAGFDVQVVDVKSGTDLTQATLTQIIIDGRGLARLLPVELLTRMVRMGDDALAEFLGRYLTMALDMYLNARRGAQAVQPYFPLASIPFDAAGALARMMGGVQLPWSAVPPPPPAATLPRATPPPPPSDPATGVPEGTATSEDVAALREELEELKEMLRTRMAE